MTDVLHWENSTGFLLLSLILLLGIQCREVCFADTVFPTQFFTSIFSYLLGLFQKLFRQDLLVASLFRNFLLAERIMRSYNCTPVSYPSLPTCYQHPMWQAWDLALDHIIGQLPALLEGKASYEVCKIMKVVMCIIVSLFL